MRILHVISGLGTGGAEMLVRDLAIECRSAGHSIGVAYVSKADDVGRSMDSERVMEAALSKAGIEVFYLGEGIRRNVFAGARSFRRLCSAFSPDVVHIHLQYGLLFRIISMCDVTVVYTHHIDRFIYSKPVFKLLSTGFDAAIAISKSNVDLLERAVRKPVFYIPNAMSRKPLGKAEVRPDGRVFRILSVGRLQPQKNYSLLLEVARLVQSSASPDSRPIEFRIAGEGQLLEALRTQAANLGVEHMVTFLGYREDIADLMASSDLFLMTSDFEGLPIALIEAAQAGMPIVATDVGGCAEVVQPGVNGFLASRGDASAISSAIMRLAADSALCTSLSEGSGEVSKSFDISVAAKRHLDVYRALVS